MSWGSMYLFGGVIHGSNPCAEHLARMRQEGDPLGELWSELSASQRVDP